MGRRQSDMVELRLFLTRQFLDLETQPRWYEALWVRLLGAGLAIAGLVVWRLHIG